ncbi:MAG: sulfotransferase [bacterium]
MQLLVLGMHRSGTSMVTRLLNLMGASLGPQEYIIAPDTRNPAGYWERADVFGVNEELLRAAGTSWDRPEGFDPAAVPGEALRMFRERARAIIANLEPFRTWVMKDPRLSILFPLWRPMLESPLCVVTFRNPLDVARSLEHRDGFLLERGLALWERYMTAALAATADVPRVLVSYEETLAQPATAPRRLLTDLVSRGARDLRWPDAGSPMDVVQAGLCHHHASAQDTMRMLTGPQRELYALLCEGAAVSGRPNRTRGACPSRETDMRS